MKKEITKKFSALLSVITVTISILAAIIQIETVNTGLTSFLLMGIATIIAAISALFILRVTRQQKKKPSGRIFLIYAKEDQERVEKIYEELKFAGFKPWMDTKDILPGERWELSIKKAIEEADVALACLSKNAVEKNGFVQKELQFALDLMDEKIEGISPVIPIRLEETQVPDKLKNLQWLDIFKKDGLERLTSTLTLAVPRLDEKTT